MKMSFIVPALNEEEHIGKCLDSVKNQKYFHESIVVDGGSEDATREIASEKGATIETDPGENAAIARNIGAEEAEGEVYCFVDSDTVLPEDWSEKAHKHFKKDEVVAVGGPLKPRNPCFKDKVVYYLTTDLSPTITSKFNFHQFQGPNMAFRATAFNNINGFREDLNVLEDNEIANRIRKEGKVVWDRDMYASESPRRFHKKSYSSETLKYLRAYVDIYLLSSGDNLEYDKCSEMD